ncbi:MAG: hypothetical protein IKB00_10705 [Bacteroidaceae bacterium]|jgi:hypothetical protein|nr:hypothetical protein [Bacteroidaceae bacterium]MBR6857142.1 hypothetical protein [Bacteroidaceae bacterium]
MEEATQNTAKKKGLMQSMPDMIQRNFWLLLEILACIIFYIGNRYAYQRDQAYAERLRRELVDMQYQTLNTTSDVSAKSKPSYVEKVATRNGSGLKPATEPPYKLPK